MADERKPQQPQRQDSPKGSATATATTVAAGTVASPPTNPLPSRNWLEEAEFYLSSKGWERTGTNERGFSAWRDPAGSSRQAEPTIEINLPAVGGQGMETIRQHVVGPLYWEYSIEEAITIQKQRDAFVKEYQSPLDRLASLERLYNSLIQDRKRLVASLQDALNNPKLSSEGFKSLVRQELAHRLTYLGESA